MPYSRRKALGAISTPFIAAIAGCSGEGMSEIGGGNTTGTESLTADNIEFPDGYGESGIEVEAAKQTNRDALGDRSYTLNTDGDTFDYGSNESTVKVEPSDGEVLIERRRRPADYNPDFNTKQTRFRYITDKEYIKTIEDGETRYHISDGPDFESQRYHIPWEILALFDFTLEELYRDGGTPIARYEAESLTDQGKEEVKDGFEEPRTAALEIDTEGLVQNYEIQLGEIGEDKRFFILSSNVTDVGQTSVTKPDWISEAKSAE